MVVNDDGAAGVGDGARQGDAAGRVAGQRGVERQLFTAFEDRVVGGRNRDNDATGGAGRHGDAVGAIGVNRDDGRLATDHDGGGTHVARFNLTTQRERQGGVGINRL